MRLPTDNQAKKRVLSALAALGGDSDFATIRECMAKDLAALDDELRAAPVSSEIGKTQGRAQYAAEFLRLAESAQETLRQLTSKTS